MGLEDNPITDSGSEASSPTVEELIFQLQSSFLPLEFQYVAKTLQDREECLKELCSNLKSKAEEEKALLLCEISKLKDQLKKQQNEIDAVNKVNGEYDRKFRVLDCDLKKKEDENDAIRTVNRGYEEKFRVLDDELKKQKNETDEMRKVKGEFDEKIRVLNDELKNQKNETDEMRKVNGEFEEKFRVLNDELKKKEEEIDAMMKVIVEYKSKSRVHEKIPLEMMNSGKEQKDFAESYIQPLFDIMPKTEPKLHEIIQIDDDDDDDENNDLEFFSTNKRSRVSDENKVELTYTSRLFNRCQNKSDPFFPDLGSQEKRSKG